MGPRAPLPGSRLVLCSSAPPLGLVSQGLFFFLELGLCTQASSRSDANLRLPTCPPCGRHKAHHPEFWSGLDVGHLTSILTRRNSDKEVCFTCFRRCESSLASSIDVKPPGKGAGMLTAVLKKGFRVWDLGVSHAGKREPHMSRCGGGSVLYAHAYTHTCTRTHTDAVAHACTRARLQRIRVCTHHICTRTYTCVHAPHAYNSTHAHVCACTHICAQYKYMRTHVHAYTHAQVRIYTRACTTHSTQCVSAHTFIYLHAYTHTYIYASRTSRYQVLSTALKT